MPGLNLNPKQRNILFNIFLILPITSSILFILALGKYHYIKEILLWCSIFLLGFWFLFMIVLAIIDLGIKIYFKIKSLK